RRVIEVGFDDADDRHAHKRASGAKIVDAFDAKRDGTAGDTGLGHGRNDLRTIHRTVIDGLARGDEASTDAAENVHAENAFVWKECRQRPEGALPESLASLGDEAQIAHDLFDR